MRAHEEASLECAIRIGSVVLTDSSRFVQITRLTSYPNEETAQRRKRTPSRVCPFGDESGLQRLQECEPSLICSKTASIAFWVYRGVSLGSDRDLVCLSGNNLDLLLF